MTESLIELFNDWMIIVCLDPHYLPILEEYTENCIL